MLNCASLHFFICFPHLACVTFSAARFLVALSCGVSFLRKGIPKSFLTRNSCSPALAASLRWAVGSASRQKLRALLARSEDSFWPGRFSTRLYGDGRWHWHYAFSLVAGYAMRPGARWVKQIMEALFGMRLSLSPSY